MDHHRRISLGLFGETKTEKVWGCGGAGNDGTMIDRFALNVGCSFDPQDLLPSACVRVHIVRRKVGT